METIWQLLQEILMNPFWGLGGFLVGIIAIILAVIFFRRGQRTKKPTFYIKSSNLVAGFTSKLDKLQILYDREQVESLTVSKIAFWNNGAQTIDSRDVAEADPLRIVSKEGCKILDVSVIYKRNESNRFRVDPTEEDGSVKMSFDYLDKDEGGVIQIIHTGKSSSDIEILGIVKGVGKPRPTYTRPRVAELIDKIVPSPKHSKAQPLRARRMTGIASFVGAIFMVVVAVAAAKDLFTTIFGFILAVLYGYFGYTVLKRRIPRGFEIVEEEI